MKFKEYQSLAARTAPKKTEENETLLNANFAMGLTGEAGEVTDYLKKVFFHGHELDQDNLIKELGDVLWYLSGIATINDIDMEEVAERNINKLKKRYPNGFSEEDSKNREE